MQGWGKAVHENGEYSGNSENCMRREPRRAFQLGVTAQ